MNMNNLEYNCTRTGSLNESEIDKNETDLSNHYLYGSGDDKSDYSYPLVGADGCLYRSNLDSAWSLGCRGQCSDGEKHDKRLKKLGKQFENNPIPESAYSDGKQAFEKHAEIAKTDSSRQIAVGVVMVPNSVDKAGDWERPENIQRFSEGYMERLAEGEAKSGVMHADFDADALTHVENRVLSGTENIGGELYPAGTWVVAKRVNDDRLWKLVEDGTLSGFSIGGWVHEATEYNPADLPDGIGYEVSRSETDTITGKVREITDATIEEISLVDTPAVPQARVLTAKSSGGEFLKADPALTGGVETATDYLVNERGHDEQSARELAGYLNRKESATASGGNGTASWLDKAKRFFTRRDANDDHDMTDDETEKQGRVLSGENVNRAMAMHDIAIDMLDGTDVRQNRLRFTDDRSTSFSLDEFAQDSKGAQTTDEPAESGRDADLESIDMDDNQMERLAELTAEKLGDAGGNDDDEQTEEKADSKAVITVEDGELTDEDREALKSALSDADGSEQTEKVDELTEAVEQLADQQEQILERIENAEGASQQKASAEAETNDDPLDKLANGLA